MTEGTSQGLFIVVAIVIFGIFVGLAYTVFGEVLQPELVNITEQVTIEASKKLEKIITDNFENTIFVFELDDLKNTAKLKGFKKGKDILDPVIPHYVNKNGVEYKINNVEENAFNKKGLTSVKIPSTVAEIGYSAFANNDLKSVIIPYSVEKLGMNTFKNNRELSEVSFQEPSQIKEIAPYSFRNSNLSKIKIPKSVVQIQRGAFEGSENLQTVELSSKTSLIGNPFPSVTTLIYYD